MSNDLIKLSWVAITGCYVSLGCSFISISPPRGDEWGEVAVVWVEGYAVVAVRAVKDSLPFVTGYRVCLMKWALCGRFHVWHEDWVPGSPLCGEVDHFSLHSQSCAGTMSLVHPLVLVQGQRASGPDQGLSLCLLASEVVRERGCGGRLVSSGVDHEPHRDTPHQW